MTSPEFSYNPSIAHTFGPYANILRATIRAQRPDIPPEDVDRRLYCGIPDVTAFAGPTTEDSQYDNYVSFLELYDLTIPAEADTLPGAM